MAGLGVGLGWGDNHLLAFIQHLTTGDLIHMGSIVISQQHGKADRVGGYNLHLHNRGKRKRLKEFKGLVQAYAAHPWLS